MKKVAILSLGLFALVACTDNSARVWRSHDREAIPPDNEPNPTAAHNVNRGDAKDWTFKTWRATY